MMNEFESSNFQSLGLTAVSVFSLSAASSFLEHGPTDLSLIYWQCLDFLFFLTLLLFES